MAEGHLTAALIATAVGGLDPPCGRPAAALAATVFPAEGLAAVAEGHSAPAKGNSRKSNLYTLSGCRPPGAVSLLIVERFYGLTV